MVRRQTYRRSFVLLLWTEQQQSPSGMFRRPAQGLGGFWVCDHPGSGLSGTQLRGCTGGGRKLFPPQEFSFFAPGQEFQPLWMVHMVTMGPILRTLEKTAPAEKGRILVRHKGPQCHSLDQGTDGGKEQIHAPSVCLP